MIQLDEQQDRLLREMGDIVGRGRRNPAYGRRVYRMLRLVARCGLQMSRWFDRAKFDSWNEARIAAYRAGR